jgi:hypothetical protein
MGKKKMETTGYKLTGEGPNLRAVFQLAMPSISQTWDIKYTHHLHVDHSVTLDSETVFSTEIKDTQTYSVEDLRIYVQNTGQNADPHKVAALQEMEAALTHS